MTIPIKEKYPSNEDYQAFYAAIGEGITLWAEIENRLSLVYSYLVFDTSQAAQDSFYSVGTFRGKLNLVNAASQSGFMRIERMATATQRLEILKNFIKSLGDHSKDRNKLAHWRVVNRGEPKSTVHSNVIDASIIEFELRLRRPHIPSPTLSEKGMETFTKQMDDTFSLLEVREHIKKVKSILHELIAFTDPLQQEINQAKLKQIDEMFKLINEKENENTSPLI